MTFDDIESEEEFITRTKTETAKKRKPYDKHMQKFECVIGYAGTCFAYCPNEINIALLHLSSGAAGSTPTLTIMNENKEQPLHETPLKNGNYRRHIALSCGADMFATVQEKNDTDEKVRSCERIITIQQTSSQKKQEFIIIPDYFKYNLIAFKKEGTHIALHGTDSRNNSNLSTEKNPHHIIIPVTVNQPHPEPKKKTLQHYFKHKLICKKIT